jgi:hypothetical protein
MVEDSAENAASCICPKCPTYDECMREADDRLFCARGETSCEPTGRGCNCGECPVWADNDLNGYYYCLEGAAE